MGCGARNEEIQAKRRDERFNMEVEILHKLFTQADVNENGTVRTAASKSQMCSDLVLRSKKPFLPPSSSCIR